MIRIIIVDGSESYQNRIKALISVCSDFEIVGTGKDLYDVFRLVRDKRPDIVVFDWFRTNDKATNVVPSLQSIVSTANFVILTDFEDDIHICEAFKAGVRGYLLKESDTEMLLESIRLIQKGTMQINPKISIKALNILSQVLTKSNQPVKTILQQADKMAPVPAVPSNISRTELRVLALIGHGYKTKEVAEYLGLSGGTVRNYLSSLMQKAGLQNRTQLALFAIKHGLAQAADF
jgi:DNA-binding NarL/FixJ family response regulator